MFPPRPRPSDQRLTRPSSFTFPTTMAAMCCRPRPAPVLLALTLMLVGQARSFGPVNPAGYNDYGTGTYTDHVSGPEIDAGARSHACVYQADCLLPETLGTLSYIYPRGVHAESERRFPFIVRLTSRGAVAATWPWHLALTLPLATAG